MKNLAPPLTVFAAAILVASSWGPAKAEPPPAPTIVIQMNIVDAKGAAIPIGTITAKDIGYGLLLTPDLKGLPPGIHGFHVHENPSCDAAQKDGQMVAAQAAGGHYDPAKTGRHQGPYGTGHLGDLPAIFVDDKQEATYPMLAPRLRVSDLYGHSLMLHAGGDNHADAPSPLGGGGMRMACGVTPTAAKP